MKPLITHLLAFVLGVMAVILWPQARQDGAGADADASRSAKNGITSGGKAAPGPGVRPKPARPGLPSLEMEIARSIGRGDLDAWIESKKGDARSHAEALVIAGLLTEDPDLIRRGIQTDPENGHLLFIGSTLPAFSQEERLAMSKRLLEAAPENAMASFISAAHLSQAGQTDAAIETLKGSTARTKMDDFRMSTQLQMEDALIAAGLSPEAARMRSVFETKLPYLPDLSTLVASLKGMEGSTTPENAAELRSMTARMGQRLRDQSRSGGIIDHLSGLALEEATLKGLPDDAPSPYQGLTVSQARESIAEERQSVRQAIDDMPELQTILSSNPDLARRYIERTRLVGELEAIQWLKSTTDSAR